jgi:hypothetical protein
MTTPHPFHGTGAPDDPDELDDWLDQNFPSGSGTASSTPPVGSGTPDIASGTATPD